MAPAPASVLAINGGSSSIKFAVYRAGRVPTLSLSGMLDRIGRSGATLSGVSEISPDMRDLLARGADDVRAAEAVALFCYQAKKWAGAFAAALGGLDTLVFSAGIGERSASIRARICEGLGFLGLGLHDERNAAHAAVISADGSRVTVRVIPTNEELMIARTVSRVLGLDTDTTEREP